MGGAHCIGDIKKHLFHQFILLSFVNVFMNSGQSGGIALFIETHRLTNGPDPDVSSVFMPEPEFMLKRIQTFLDTPKHRLQCYFEVIWMKQ